MKNYYIERDYIRTDYIERDYMERNYIEQQLYYTKRRLYREKIRQKKTILEGTR